MTEVLELEETRLVEIIETDSKRKPAPPPSLAGQQSKKVTHKGFRIRKEIK